MNLRDLEYLIALEKWGNFGKAARESFVSQPTLSGQIKKMEEELGVLLVERGSRSILFTEAGNKILEHARKVLAEVNTIYEVGKSYANPLSGSLTLAVIPSIAPFILPDLVQRFSTALPDIEFTLMEQMTHTIKENIHNGMIDIAILALPINDDQLFEQSLYIEPFYLAVPENHKLAKKKSISMNDLKGESILLLEDGHCFGNQVLQLCHRVSDKEIHIIKGTSLETIVNMVRLGNGITLLPELTIHQKSYEYQEKPLVYIPFVSPMPSRDVGILYRKNSPRVQCFGMIADIVKEVVQLKNDSGVEVIPI